MFKCAEFYSSTEPVDLLDHSKFMWSLLTQNVAARSVSAHMGVLVNACASERLCVDPCGRVCVCVCLCVHARDTHSRRKQSQGRRHHRLLVDVRQARLHVFLRALQEQCRLCHPVAKDGWRLAGPFAMPCRSGPCRACRVMGLRRSGMAFRHGV